MPETPGTTAFGREPGDVAQRAKVFEAVGGGRASKLEPASGSAQYVKREGPYQSPSPA